VALVTLVYNGQDFEDMEVFGEEREADLRKFLELPGGIPNVGTFFRILKRVNAAELARYLYELLGEAWDCVVREVRDYFFFFANTVTSLTTTLRTSFSGHQETPIG
jgi:hypothetical protein